MSRSTRAWAWQFLAIVIFAAFVLWLGHNARDNMAARNITFGFDFLWRTAGFDIPFHLLRWENTDTYGYALLVCVLNSLLCAAMSIVLASALGLLIALMRLSGNPLAAGIARGSWSWCATRRNLCRSSSSTSRCCRACRRHARASCSAAGSS